MNQTPIFIYVALLASSQTLKRFLIFTLSFFIFFFKNEWKKHFKEQCALLKKYNVFWAYFLPSLLNEFSSNISQEFFQSELFFPQNLQLVGKYI